MSKAATDYDLELVVRYTREHDESAFAEIVRRQLALVYSAALRQVRSPQLAEEVAQSVFIDLARTAPRLAPDTILTAWLYQVTRRTAIDFVRREVRRQLREQVATELPTMNAITPGWAHLEPLLDEAMHTLDETERTAVLLRYFENKSLREVGATLGTSDDAAQKRVSRAVERLREYFSKRGVTVGASGLIVVISTHAVQAAPVGLAATISTAATLAGSTFLGTATVKAMTMTTAQKFIITATLVALVGTGVYEAKQASVRPRQRQLLQQQAEQIQQLQQEHQDLTNRLGMLVAENAALKASSGELLKLRGEVARLRGDLRESTALRDSHGNDPMAAAAKSWLARANQLKEFVEQNPGEKIPEFKFLTEREWLAVADAGLTTEFFQTNDYSNAMQALRSQAETKFAHQVQSALGKYATANNGQFPSDLSRLRPYCEPAVGDLLLELYEIKSAQVLSPWLVEDLKIKTDWIITRTKPVTPNATSRLAIFADGNAYWQSPP